MLTNSASSSSADIMPIGVYGDYKDPDMVVGVRKFNYKVEKFHPLGMSNERRRERRCDQFLRSRFLRRDHNGDMHPIGIQVSCMRPPYFNPRIKQITTPNLAQWPQIPATHTDRDRRYQLYRDTINIELEVPLAYESKTTGIRVLVASFLEYGRTRVTYRINNSSVLLKVEDPIGRQSLTNNERVALEAGVRAVMPSWGHQSVAWVVDGFSHPVYISFQLEADIVAAPTLSCALKHPNTFDDIHIVFLVVLWINGWILVARQNLENGIFLGEIPLEKLAFSALGVSLVSWPHFSSFSGGTPPEKGQMVTNMLRAWRSFYESIHNIFYKTGRKVLDERMTCLDKIMQRNIRTMINRENSRIHNNGVDFCWWELSPKRIFSTVATTFLSTAGVDEIAYLTGAREPFDEAVRGGGSSDFFCIPRYLRAWSKSVCRDGVGGAEESVGLPLPFSCCLEEQIVKNGVPDRRFCSFFTYEAHFIHNTVMMMWDDHPTASHNWFIDPANAPEPDRQESFILQKIAVDYAPFKARVMTCPANVSWQPSHPWYPSISFNWGTNVPRTAPLPLTWTISVAPTKAKAESTKILTASEKEAADNKEKAALADRIVGFDPRGFSDEKPAPVRPQLPAGSSVQEVLEKVESENKRNKTDDEHDNADVLMSPATPPGVVKVDLSDDSPVPHPKSPPSTKRSAPAAVPPRENSVSKRASVEKEKRHVDSVSDVKKSAPPAAEDKLSFPSLSSGRPKSPTKPPPPRLDDRWASSSTGRRLPPEWMPKSLPKAYTPPSKANMTSAPIDPATVPVSDGSVKDATPTAKKAYDLSKIMETVHDLKLTKDSGMQAFMDAFPGDSDAARLANKEVHRAAYQDRLKRVHEKKDCEALPTVAQNHPVAVTEARAKPTISAPIAVPAKSSSGPPPAPPLPPKDTSVGSASNLSSVPPKTPPSKAKSLTTSKGCPPPSKSVSQQPPLATQTVQGKSGRQFSQFDNHFENMSKAMSKQSDFPHPPGDKPPLIMRKNEKWRDDEPSAPSSAPPLPPGPPVLASHPQDWYTHDWANESWTQGDWEDEGGWDNARDWSSWGARDYDNDDAREWNTNDWKDHLRSQADAPVRNQDKAGTSTWRTQEQMDDIYNTDWSTATSRKRNYSVQQRGILNALREKGDGFVYISCDDFVEDEIFRTRRSKNHFIRGKARQFRRYQKLLKSQYRKLQSQHFAHVDIEIKKQMADEWALQEDELYKKEDPHPTSYWKNFNIIWFYNEEEGCEDLYFVRTTPLTSQSLAD